VGQNKGKLTKQKPLAEVEENKRFILYFPPEGR